MSRIIDDRLPPPEPPDAKGTRPELNLPHVVRQVNDIQRFLREDRERVKKTKEDGQ